MRGLGKKDLAMFDRLVWTVVGWRFGVGRKRTDREISRKIFKMDIGGG